MMLADGASLDVEGHELNPDGTAELALWIPPERALEAGQAFTLTAGCDKTFATCKARFANHLNFRGFPHVPGADFAYSYADGERVHDGSPIFE